MKTNKYYLYFAVYALPVLLAQYFLLGGFISNLEKISEEWLLIDFWVLNTDLFFLIAISVIGFIVASAAILYFIIAIFKFFEAIELNKISNCFNSKISDQFLQNKYIIFEYTREQETHYLHFTSSFLYGVCKYRKLIKNNKNEFLKFIYFLFSEAGNLNENLSLFRYIIAHKSSRGTHEISNARLSCFDQNTAFRFFTLFHFVNNIESDRYRELNIDPETISTIEDFEFAIAEFDRRQNYQQERRKFRETENRIWQKYYAISKTEPEKTDELKSIMCSFYRIQYIDDRYYEKLSLIEKILDSILSKRYYVSNAQSTSYITQRHNRY